MASRSSARSTPASATPPEDDDPIPISALQHYLYCPRQCALIHVERQWAENLLTAEGRILHERSDQPGEASRGDRRIVRGMPLRSKALGIAGVADVVELTRRAGRWQPHPIEYKRGRPKAPIVGNWGADEVQLCAQALCLEEMLATRVPEGALFYGKVRRRRVVVFDDELRSLTRRIAHETRAMIAAGQTPRPVYQARLCNACSLRELCRPKRLARVGSVAAWLHRRIEEVAPPGAPSAEPP